MKAESFLGWLLSDSGTMAIAGAAGGVVRWITLRDNWREGVPAIVVGGICANYLGPLVVPIIEPVVGKLAPAGDPLGLSAFIVGLGGISLSGLVIDIFKARRAKVGSPDE